MARPRNNLKPELVAQLSTVLDAQMTGEGFARRGATDVYVRCLPDCEQRVKVAAEHGPKDFPGDIAAIYPWLEVRMPAIARVEAAMTLGNPDLERRVSGVLVHQPVEFTAPKGVRGRWRVRRAEDLPSVMIEVGEFVRTWTLPFLKTYATPADVCETYDRGDSRVITPALRVAAAMVICGRAKDAAAVMERWHGNPWQRKRHQCVFEYLARLAGV